MNYVDTFIVAAEDCPVSHGVVPESKADKKKSVAAIQYQLLAENPYELTQEDVLFQTHVLHKQVPEDELKTRGAAMRQEFFAKPQPCLRTSPLARKYGWGFHCDRAGKVALYPVGSSEYQQFSSEASGSVSQHLKAFRSSRG
ncbi:MAG: hypothetical protein JF888_13620 [Candidatus Dormibacteraeota bacterium]|uniref:Uncharacterized protein n=1 Tax=Candidatus Dormiibacter inghamiae TaxID=3127013 RepID=A0A934K9D9_9BACT|nr:hypothetical protein [Candidatus Dormibacteraeota bacterium]MBJ7606371.1 hypothetical protein [Candidatus Dormibacteraeota bacterium]